MHPVLLKFGKLGETELFLPTYGVLFAVGALIAWWWFLRRGRTLGVPDEQLFAPFWTDKEKGSGLGLATARRIVGDQGGTLKLADRDDGPGAVATIGLPLSPSRPG